MRSRSRLFKFGGFNIFLLTQNILSCSGNARMIVGGVFGFIFALSFTDIGLLAGGYGAVLKIFAPTASAFLLGLLPEI